MLNDMFKGVMSTVHLEPKNLTMDKKLIICIAPTGSFTKRDQNPDQPYTAKEIAQHVIQSYDEGAAMWHIHVRDDKGVPSKDPKVISRMIDMVMDKCPDIITSNNVHSDYTKGGLGRIKPMIEGLLAEGAKTDRKYVQTAVLRVKEGAANKEGGSWPITEPVLREMVEYLQDKGVKPEFQCHDFTGIYHINEWLIKPGIVKKPAHMNIIMGFHGHDYSSPTTPDPWGYIYLMTMIQMMPAGNVMGVACGGHNWLPMVIVGIILGADYVRIGMEDTVWMYPHKDEKIKKCADVVRKVATIARELGRDIATPDEARKILGLNP